jgi:nucleoside-diphosphate-sugar epimerase
MKIVVLGALGHIGSKLIRDLPDRFPGAEILLVDNFLVQRYSSLFNLPAHGRYRFVEADVSKDDLTSQVQGANVIIHLAAITNAAGSFDRKEELKRNNFDATQNAAKLSLMTSAPLIFISTTSVYGTQAARVNEDCTRADLQPQSPYAECKLEEEDFLTAMGKTHGLKFITCRFGTIFGTSVGMRFHTAVNKFCWQAVMGQPITVWKTALHQFRPYLDVEDAVDALQFIIEKEVYPNDIFNVLTANLTVFDILESIKKCVPNYSVEYVDSKIMNQLSYEVECDKFSKLGFKYKGSLNKQIKATVDLIKNANIRI